MVSNASLIIPRMQHSKRNKPKHHSPFEDATEPHFHRTNNSILLTILAGPRGFEPLFSGFLPPFLKWSGGRRLNPCWATGPLFYKVKRVLLEINGCSLDFAYFLVYPPSLLFSAFFACIILHNGLSKLFSGRFLYPSQSV